jgi:hypothetical protein
MVNHLSSEATFAIDRETESSVTRVRTHQFFRSDNAMLIRFWKRIGIVRRNLFWLNDKMEADRTSLAGGCPGRRAAGRSPRHQRRRARAEERLSLVRLPARVWSSDNDL